MAASGGPPDNAPLRTPQGPGSGHQLQIQMPLESVSVAVAGKVRWERAERAGNPGAPQRISWWTPRSIRAVFPGFSLYVTADEPSWHDIADGAGRLARDLGINASCWEQARSSMGAEQRLVALGLVAELLSQGRIASSAGQYFGGLLKKARIGALDLDRSVWGLQQRRADVGVNPPLREIGAKDRDVSP